MSFDKHTEILKKFCLQSKYCVLALLSIRTTGINLVFCSMIMFLDQPWSAQDVLQMTGRVHRQPQKNPILSIHLLGNETTNILVTSMAEGKQDMMEVFLSKKAGQGGGGDVNNENEDSISTASIKTHVKKIMVSNATNTDAESVSATPQSVQPVLSYLNIREW
ncbi:hypothetical protein HYPSUDRAFT_208169 [Hypholoma sublateritium FD-334 SS-4]|uniref:Helicase C-terminal domain-containing protein n=1 Tax=Hypholoma sublateritium (strain FD-334 SS-4) TaxID=945553 RepID=A0A0D2LW89_HYPSF|nr:hypothetical protein HYPSUDRAFT_208169 [Hypholoma sublateritium FD-334 SS-4]